MFGLAVTLSASNGHCTERSCVSQMHHGPGKWRSKTTRGGLAMAPRGIGTSHGVCRTTRVPCADLPRFGFYTAVSTIFRGLGLEPALLLLHRTQPWPSVGNRDPAAKSALGHFFLSTEATNGCVRSIRQDLPDRSHPVLAQTDKFKCSNADLTAASRRRLTCPWQSFPFLKLKIHF